jgi:hypothetical protein
LFVGGTQALAGGATLQTLPGASFVVNGAAAATLSRKESSGSANYR